MKTIEIKNVLKAGLLVVELPKTSKGVIFNEGDNSLTFETENNIIVGYDLDGYTLLGKPDEISEENASELVESWESVAKDGISVFENYKDSVPKKRTATESLMSALEAEVYWDVNPIPTPEIQGGYTPDGCFVGGWDDNWISEFEKAESRTFDRNRTLIFKKN